MGRRSFCFFCCAELFINVCAFIIYSRVALDVQAAHMYILSGLCDRSHVNSR